MRSPRTPGAGITGAATFSLGGEAQFLADVGSLRNSVASECDRQADHLLHLGYRQQAERLAHRAADLRVGDAA